LQPYPDRETGEDSSGGGPGQPIPGRTPILHGKRYHGVYGEQVDQQCRRFPCPIPNNLLHTFVPHPYGEPDQNQNSDGYKYDPFSWHTGSLTNQTFDGIQRPTKENSDQERHDNSKVERYIENVQFLCANEQGRGRASGNYSQTSEKVGVFIAARRAAEQGDERERQKSARNDTMDTPTPQHAEKSA
jgi:hypothetical protein